MHKIEREFLLVERIQQTEFDCVMSIDVTPGNSTMRQQRVVSITCYKCSQNVIIEKTQMVTAYYPIP